MAQMYHSENVTENSLRIWSEINPLKVFSKLCVFNMFLASNHFFFSLINSWYYSIQYPPNLQTSSILWIFKQEGCDNLLLHYLRKDRLARKIFLCRYNNKLRNVEWPSMTREEKRTYSHTHLYIIYIIDICVLYWS